jgi:hypothetical protein
MEDATQSPVLTREPSPSTQVPPWALQQSRVAQGPSKHLHARHVVASAAKIVVRCGSCIVMAGGATLGSEIG